MFVLDTDHISLLQRIERPASECLFQRLQSVPESSVHFTVVSFHEQALGWNARISQAKSMADVIEGYRRFETMLAHYDNSSLLSFNTAAGEMFLRLRKSGVRIGTTDLRIASIALTANMTLLTRNTRDFQRVPGLRIDDWTKPV